MHRNVITRGILAVVLLGSTTVLATAQGYDHIDKLARRVEKQAKIVHNEADKHFPKATSLHRQARELEKLASHLHDLVHERGQINHMRADAKRMDRIIHDMEEQLADLRGANPAGRRALGHIREAVKDLHDSLTHLRKDLKY